MSNKTEIILIDGYNKSLFKNLLEKYLEKFPSNIKYIMIDINDYVQYTSKTKDYYGNKGIKRKELIDQDSFLKEIQEYLDKNQILFIFNTSRLIQKKFFFEDDDDEEDDDEEDDDDDEDVSLNENDKTPEYIYIDQIQYIINYKFDNISSTFLKKETKLFNMNSFLCAIRLNDTNTFTNTFMPFGGYLAFNYLECLLIDSYYNDFIISNKLSFKTTFKNIIIYKLGTKYDEKEMISMLNSILFKNKIKSISIILLVFIFHLLFYLPYYILIITKIKEKKINVKNKTFLYILLLFPVALLIIPSWMMLFIPEFINFMALYKLYKLN